MHQTTIQDRSAIRKGSVRVLVGDDFSSLVDIGALRNPVLTSLIENQSIEFDNVSPLKKFVKGDRIQLAFDLAEINFDSIAALDAGAFTLSSVAGTPVNNASQLVVAGQWNFGQFILIENQNGDNSPVTVDSVTGSTDGLLTADTDYHVVQDEQGRTGIIVHEVGSPALTENQNLTIVYDYTPNASKKLTFNASGDKVLKCMRITNTDEDGRVLKLDIEEGTNMEPISVDFAGDDEDDVAVMPVTFEGKVVEWVDEQAA